MRLGAGLYSAPNGSQLLDLGRARGVKISTNERGFAAFTGTVPLSLQNAFAIYDRPTLPHVAAYWPGGVIWEGRLEDTAIVPGGLRLTALGYIRGYSDVPYSSAHIGVTAATIVRALIVATNALNSFMAVAPHLVQDPGVTLAEIYEDRYPIEILDRLCNLGDSQTTPRLWEAGVWEDRILHFRPRGDAARNWVIDVAEPEIERTLETLYNGVYAIYQDGGNQRTVTATSADAGSIARYGLTRRAAIGLQAIDSALAAKVRDAYLADHKDPPVRAGVGFRKVYDQAGVLYPAYVVRSGDTLRLRNLPPTLSTDIDRIRNFRIKETNYDADADYMTVVPESLRPGLSPQDNASRLASVTDPNLQYQPRPTLAELYADFKGLLGLRGLWYPGSTDNAGALYDQSGQGRTLTYNGNPTLNVHGGFIPCYDLDGAGDFFSRPDEAGLDIVGTETTIASAKRGLTFGGWFSADDFSVSPGLISKFAFTAGNQRSYDIQFVTTGAARLEISSDGTSGNQQGVNSSNVAPTGVWKWVVGRFTPSTELAIFLDATKTVFTTSVKASLFNSNAAFQVGALDAGTRTLDGRCAIAFICAALLTDEQINHQFERTRKFFGV